VVVGDLIGEGSAQEQSVVGEPRTSPPGCKPWLGQALSLLLRAHTGWLAISSNTAISEPSS
jgi:hypothetical protein